MDLCIFTTSLITRVLGVGQKDGHFRNTGIHLLLNQKIYQLVYAAGFSCRLNIFFYSNMLPQMLLFLLFEFDVMSSEQIVKKKQKKKHEQKKQRKEERKKV